MRRMIYLVTAALVAMLILVPAAMAQQTTRGGTTMRGGGTTMMMQQPQQQTPLPKSGGPGIGSVLLPAGALLLGSGVLAYAVQRHRRR